MTDRPILFTPENAQKVHDSTKTQTRRIVKPQPNVVHAIYADGSIETERIFRTGDQRIHCPYGQVGDRLWVREALRKKDDVMAYADGSPVTQGGLVLPSLGEKNTIPSIYMPKWACRTWLELTEVRVERLQEITETDAIAEGCIDAYGPDFHAGAFRTLWASIHGAGSWERNPWVWVLCLHVCKENT